MQGHSSLAFLGEALQARVCTQALPFRVPTWVCNSTALVSLPVTVSAGQGRARGRQAVPGNHGTSAAGLAGRGRREHYLTGTATAGLTVLIRGSKELLKRSYVHRGRGKAWGLCISPTSRIPPKRPLNTPLSAAYLTPPPLCQWKDTVYSQSSAVAVSVSANSPSASKASAPHQHPRHPRGHLQTRRVRNIRAPSGVGKVTPASSPHSRGTRCPLRGLLSAGFFTLLCFP